MSFKRAFLLAILLVLSGCSTNAPNVYHCYGYVRSVWADERKWSIVVEGDNGVIFTVTGTRHAQDIPPVWQGLHAEMSYQSYDDYWTPGGYTNFQVIRRLP